MKQIEAVDAHHHLWDLEERHYPWLTPNPAGDPFPDFAELCRSYRIEDYRADCANQDIVKSVHVQAEHDPDAPVRETAWLQEIADHPRSGGFPHAIVAGADLSRKNAESVLESQLTFANVRGLRQILNAESTAASAGSAESALEMRASQLENEDWLCNFSLLRRFDLSFELQLFPWQTERAATLISRHPDTQIILNHALMPFDRSDEGLALWRGALEACARFPNVVIKISGLGMAPGGTTEAMSRRLIEETLEFFGSERCLFASNFPVDRLWTDYGTLWGLFRDVVSSLSEDEQRAVLRGNAERVYRI